MMMGGIVAVLELVLNESDTSDDVIAGLVPATLLREAQPRHMIGVAGRSPAMTNACAGQH
jgi:hypothetical protein